MSRASSPRPQFQHSQSFGSRLRRLQSTGSRLPSPQFLVSLGLVGGLALAVGCSEEGGPGGAPSVDANGDGVNDALGTTVDANGDGRPDEIDLDGDGEMDGIGVDTDGDGKADAVGIDTDGDGIIDALDTDGDGKPDEFAPEEPVGGTGGTSSGGSASQGDAPWTPGLSSIVQSELPDGEPVACEWDWTIRLLAPYPNYQVGHAPRRMYVESCGEAGGEQTLLTSYTIGEKVDAGLAGTSGAITVSRFDPSNEELTVKETYHFPECRSMHGIAAGSDCGLVAALCRIENTAAGEDHDPVAGWKDADWITNENTCGQNPAKMNDHMWLYEWPDGDLSKEPTKVIVHKSIGSWEFGSNYLRFGENDDTYGIALKTTVGSDTGCHEADSYMVLDRSDYSFADRGWDWACASGHTIQNRPAYDPATKKYAMLCSTDWNEEGTANEVEVAFRREDQPKDVIQHLSRYNALWIKGGAGPIVARDGGGYLGLLVGEPLPLSSTYDDSVPTRIGLVVYGDDGNRVGDVKWLAQDEKAFLSWPQLAPLGNDTYLIGWGEGFDSTLDPEKAEPERNLSLRVPWTYYSMEINGQGNALTDPVEMTEAGWGEVNEMVSLGPGRVAWSYVPEDRRASGVSKGPDCNQDSLVHYVYTSATQP